MTFSFTMDSFPGYTYFDKSKKVLCVIQIVEDTKGTINEAKSVMGNHDAHKTTEEDESI